MVLYMPPITQCLRAIRSTRTANRRRSLIARPLLLTMASCGSHVKSVESNPVQPTSPFHENTTLPEISPPSVAPANPNGVITSGGGHVIGYESNPWFLGNTHSVRYCIDLNEAEFGISKAAAEGAVARAIGLWLKALQTASYPAAIDDKKEVLILGTQTFAKKSCANDDIDVRFQLGTLTAEQRTFLVEPTQFVAAAVQTSYDTKKMRGRGFIYVAPERGALRPNLNTTNPPNAFWKINDGINLDMTLIHELGHVFGLQHTSSGFPMGTDLCNNLVRKTEQKTSQDLAMNNPTRDQITRFMERLFSVNGGIRRIHVSQQFGTAHDTLFGFDLAANDTQFEIKLLPSTSQDVPETIEVWTVSSVNHPNERMMPGVNMPQKLLSTFEISTVEKKYSGTHVNLIIPKDQQVMPSKTVHLNSIPLLQSITYEIQGRLSGNNSNLPTVVQITTLPGIKSGQLNNELRVNVITNGLITKLK